MKTGYKLQVTLIRDSCNQTVKRDLSLLTLTAPVLELYVLSYFTLIKCNKRKLFHFWKYQTEISVSNFFSYSIV